MYSAHVCPLSCRAIGVSRVSAGTTSVYIYEVSRCIAQRTALTNYHERAFARFWKTPSLDSGGECLVKRVLVRCERGTPASGHRLSLGATKRLIFRCRRRYPEDKEAVTNPSTKFFLSNVFPTMYNNQRKKLWKTTTEWVPPILPSFGLQRDISASIFIIQGISEYPDGTYNNGCSFGNSFSNDITSS